MAQNFYANTLSTKPAKTVTPQTRALPGREAEMVTNSAGGKTFQLDMWGYLDRFLILGSDKPSYYASAQKLTKDAAKNVLTCLKADGTATVDRIVEISHSGRAPKNDPAIFALALASIFGNEDTSKYAYAALPKVCRTGTHLFQFVSTLDELGKWNAAAKRGVAAWYTKRMVDKTAMQVLKYQQRDGWSHRDVLRLAHVKPENDLQSNLFRYVVKGAEGMEQGMAIPPLVIAYEELKRNPTKQNALRIISAYPDFTWEMMPTELQRDKDVMAALIPNMGVTALIRKLGQLTNLGLIAPLTKGSELGVVISRLSDAEALKAGRVHPITLLMALKTYAQGHGDRGSLTWAPAKAVIDALNDAFYAAFDFIPTTGQGYLLGLDISGSMFGGAVAGAPGLVPAEISAVMALAVAKRESNYEMYGFDTQPKQLKLSPTMRLDDVLMKMRSLRWSAGGTDCAQPMLLALQEGWSGVNKFCVYTDNETYAGSIQPVEALARYRAKHVRDAKLIVCGTSTTNFTIADPKDPGMLDIVGFDSAAPQLIQSF
jgi:60 kDa SS-A/Ro ribonucleoprotein